MVGDTRPFGRAIAHIAQSNRARHVLQFAIAIGGTCQTIKRVIADIQLHHPAAQFVQLGVLGMNHHTLGHGCRAGGGRAAPPLDFDNA